ncbi:NADH:ubiquinone oxidoreductase subunit NDUFA12 [uncultured Albimonas sp.]|uniref:NADH:ubiquinone oxidoreductase subunit NDUFA12 n=1 Tax=uncultured Albimonas sp. TaxID=1331701 RepID=UPI0030EF3E1E|tara:strand:+ start:1835 stop:2215 length:381 start_codon:yes stop_codon:yes gene_type:complete
MIDTLKSIFTWWNGAPIITRLTVSRQTKVGEDDLGNTYWRTADGKRRWVLYKGEAEASMVPPDWHGWLHFTWDETPTEKPLPTQKWEKPHRPNLTGTEAAYHPPGSVLTPATRPRVAGDYEAWTPE